MIDLTPAELIDDDRSLFGEEFLEEDMSDLTDDQVRAQFDEIINERAVIIDAAELAALLTARADAKAAQVLVLERAAEVVPQGWCAETTKHKDMDVDLGLAIQEAILSLADVDGLAEVAKLRERAEKAETQFDRLDAAWSTRVAALEADAHAAREAASNHRADRERLAAELAACKEREAGLRDFVEDFAKAKIDALRYSPPYGASPDDEPDPVVDAETVWAWQADALAALAQAPAPTEEG